MSQAFAHEVTGVPSVDLSVDVLAMTDWVPGALLTILNDTGWSPTGAASAGEELVEFAGRECYQSWGKPNQATATSTGYLEHIVDVGHESVLEHVNITLRLRGVSRSLTHELVRHRHGSYSQLSQRYVNEPLESVVVPPLFRGDSVAEAILERIREVTAWAYAELAQHGEDLLTLQGVDGVQRRKQAREAARSVLPNMTPTAIVVTMNWRAWRWFLLKRDSEHADLEIQELAIAVRRALEQVGGRTALSGTEREANRG